jgi:hypothetical protein
MLEETAWEFAPTDVIGLYLWTHPESAEQFLRVVFTGELGEHDPDRELDDGILRTLWLSRDDLLKRSEQLRSPMVLRAVDDYLTGDRYPLDVFRQLAPDDLAARAKKVV